MIRVQHMVLSRGAASVTITLNDLPFGAVFWVGDVGAVKSEYKYTNDPDSQWQCVLLASGEYAHFPDKNRTIITSLLSVQVFDREELL